MEGVFRFKSWFINALGLTLRLLFLAITTKFRDHFILYHIISI